MSNDISQSLQEAEMLADTILESDILSDDLVAEYLQNNPHFFNQQPQLLAALKLSDSKRGVVSLVERQQQVQRQKIQNLEEEITNLMTVASYNQSLFSVYNDLYLNLIDCNTVAQFIDCLNDTVVNLLNLSGVKFCLKKHLPEQHPSLMTSGFEPILDQRLAHEEFYFGRLNANERQALFAQQTVGSVVLIKLTDKSETLGFIAINSADPEHFQPGMDLLLLNQFRSLVAKLLVKLITH
ncbi:DUF484 family protein [Thalassotalea aquiviva]|uniref:DUF484 family protein n=1 Tax=Thalassotalea aquiviva TaxID=3242415 RepID=UPI00352A7475